MSPTHALRWVAALALLAVAGIVGLLLAGPRWHGLCLGLAWAPLLLGAWRAWRQRPAGPTDRQR